MPLKLGTSSTTHVTSQAARELSTGDFDAEKESFGREFTQHAAQWIWTDLDGLDGPGPPGGLDTGIWTDLEGSGRIWTRSGNEPRAGSGDLEPPL